MSREIKFRAWHEEEMEYFDGETSNMFSWVEDGQPIVLEQYTGLFDKHGVEIYEGDIVAHWKQGARLVIYPLSNDHACYGLVSASGMKGTLSNPDKLYEVIGNIHQNLELLK